MRWTIAGSLALCLACAGADPTVHGTDRDTARIAIVRSAYANGCDTPLLSTLPFSPQAQALLAKDAAYEKRTGRIGNLDFAPLVNGQDCDQLALLDVTAKGDRVTARVRNFEEFELVWVFEGEWLVDLEGPSGSLVAILARPHD